MEEESRQANEDKYDEAWAKLKRADGVLVPGGFSGRGVEGKMCAAYAQKAKSVLGYLGMQIAVIEFAETCVVTRTRTQRRWNQRRNTDGYFHARRIQDTHGRYHAFRFPRNYFQTKECVSWRLYGKKDSVAERHRHRYEVNPEMVDELEQKGLKFVGKDETGTRMEICELAKHPFYVACQYHPEFKSRPGDRVRCLWVCCWRRVDSWSRTYPMKPSS